MRTHHNESAVSKSICAVEMHFDHLEVNECPVNSSKTMCIYIYTHIYVYSGIFALVLCYAVPVLMGMRGAYGRGIDSFDLVSHVFSHPRILWHAKKEVVNCCYIYIYIYIYI